MGAMLLFTACHRSPKPEPTDSSEKLDISKGEIRDPEVVDTSNDVKHQLPDSELPSHTLQQDTAEITNLRRMARKQRTIYSPALLVGEWLHGSEHEHYLADGSGNRWDIGDDVDRQEAQAFSWTMDSNLLTMKYNLSLGGLVVRQYVVTFVDDETLVYRDAYGGAYMWDKVPADFTDHPTQPRNSISE